MPTTTLMPLPKQQYLTVLGTPLVGGKVYTYAAGGTVPKPTYTDAAGTTPQANPIPLNLRGEPAAPIFWSGNYRVDVRDALGNLIYSVDNYNTDPAGILASLGNLMTSAGSTLIGFLQSGASAVLQTLQEKLRQSLNVMDWKPDGTGAADATALIQAAINELAARGSGRLDCKGGQRFKITSTLDFTALGAGHTPYEIDFGGATFVWGGDPLSTLPMFKGYNNKSVQIHNFVLLGSPNSVRAKVIGIFMDSLQPGGSDLVSFKGYRIAYCDYAVVLGSTGAGQNRVSDSQISLGVIENCRIGLSIRSTDVDSLVVGPCTIISSCDEAIEMVRAGFLKIYDVTGYNCPKFITKKGPTEAILVENCQSERGDLASSIFFYQSNYTLARRAPITFLNSVADDKIWLDYDPLVGSDPQIVNIIGGLFTDLSIDAPDATVNLIGTTQVAGGVMATSGLNSKINNIGSKIYGDAADYANARRFPLYGDASDNYAIGTAPGLLAAVGRSTLVLSGPTSSLIGLAVGDNPIGYLAAAAGKIELGATGANRVDVTAGEGPVFSATQNGAFNLTPLSAPPASPNPGAIYYNGPNKKFYGYDGTTWTVFN